MSYSQVLIIYSVFIALAIKLWIEISPFLLVFGEKQYECLMLAFKRLLIIDKTYPFNASVLMMIKLMTCQR